MNGLHVSILRYAADLSDCTGDGVTGLKRRVYLDRTAAEGVGATTATLLGVGGPFEPCDRHPTLIVQRRGDYVYAVPCDAEGVPLKRLGHVGPMMGGNFVYTSDSRFRNGVCEYPIPVHDRFETREDYLNND